MGFRQGGPFGTMGIAAAPPSALTMVQSQQQPKEDTRFISSYAATFTRHPAASSNRGFAPALGSSAAAAPPAGPLGPSKPADPIAGRGGLLRLAGMNSVTRLPAASSQEARSSSPVKAEAAPGPGSTRPLSFPDAPELPAGIGPLQESKLLRRKTLEMLADPNLEGIAKTMFQQHNPDNSGRMAFQDLCRALRALHSQLHLPEPDMALSEQLFKKSDINNDGVLVFAEFFELFMAQLRRSAFDRSNVIGREFFVNKSNANIWDKYERKKQLGVGTFGTAYLAASKVSGQELVIKAVQKSRTKIPIEDIEKEILIMRQVDHPHLVRLFEWFEDRARIYLVLEALQGGTLKDLLLLWQKQNKAVHEDWTRSVIRQCVDAMAYCHTMRLIHKDLKDENVMLLRQEQHLDEPFVVIIDLGIAEMFSPAHPEGKVIGGTPMTMAPEVWDGTFGPKCDVWSIGCILFELLAGDYPFLASSMTTAAWQRLHKRGPNWDLVKTSAQGKSLCKAMLTYHESERPTMRQCALHEWFVMGRPQLKKVMPAQFQPLQTFYKHEAMKRSLLLQLASKLPLQHAIRIAQIFESLDTNRDGHLSLQEIEEGFLQLGLPNETSHADMVELFQSLDVDRDGQLSFTEFAAGALLLFEDVLEEQLKALFQKHDTRGEGSLNMEQLQELLADVFAMAPGADLKGPDFLEKVRQGKQDRIPYEEVRRYVLKPHEPR